MSGGAIGEYQKFVSLPQKSFSLEPPKIYEETRSWDPKGDTRKFLFQQKEDAINLLALYTLKTLDPRYSLNSEEKHLSEKKKRAQALIDMLEGRRKFP